MKPLLQALQAPRTLFALATLLSLSPFVSQAAQSGDFSYESDGSTITITDYTGPGGHVSIPGTIDGLPVLSVGQATFYQCSNLTSVVIPSGVTTLGSFAFGSCVRLTNATFPSSVTTLGNAAFSQCTSLGHITLPDRLTSLGGFAFFQCSNLASVIIPSGVPAIGDRTFYRCTSLTSITIPASVAAIGDYAFESCASLANITIPSSVGRIGNSAFHTCASLTNLTIPNSVTLLGDHAFYECTALTSVTISGSLTNLMTGTFSWCRSLRGAYFLGHAPALASSVFYMATNATIYYLPGTTGWGPDFAGRPTALWQLPYPVILNLPPAFGVQTNHFGFRVSWATNASLIIEAFPSLTAPTWSPIATATLTNGWFDFSTPFWNHIPTRFYRVRSP